MRLCERHRGVMIAAPRKNAAAKVARYVASNPDACPYCLLWKDLPKRGSGKKK